MTPHPDLLADVEEARVKVTRLQRALARLCDADLYDPATTKPEDEEPDLARHRRATRIHSPTPYITETPLAVYFMHAMKAVHDCGMGLLGLDDLDELPCLDHPPIPGHTRILEVRTARLMVAQLLAVLDLIPQLEWMVAEQIAAMRALGFVLGAESKVKRGDEEVTVRLGPLDAPIWKALAEPPKRERPKVRMCSNEACPAPARKRGTQCAACARWWVRYRTERPVDAA